MGEESQSIPTLLQRLRNPEIFLQIPPSFKYNRDPTHKDLSAKNHLTAAVLSQLLILSSSSVKELIDYWQIRLSCLHILQQAEIAHAESRRVNEILGQNTSTAIPWSFRIVLAMSYPSHNILNELYHLVAMLREKSFRNGGDAERSVIKEQLKELSFYIGATLISLKDYQTAINHFSSYLQINGRDYNILLLTGLLYLQIGDTLQAEQHFHIANDLKENCASEYLPLLLMVKGDWKHAVESWSKLSPNSRVKENHAVSLFYAGRLSESIALFQSTLPDLIDPYSQSVVHEQLVNLYELRNQKPPTFETQ